MCCVDPVSQNMSMWQSYAVKRQTVYMRAEKEAGNASPGKLHFPASPGKHPKHDFTTSSRYERVWLFHGTDQDTVPKIYQQGFNRSFCGKNATMYGKGVYFARVSAAVLQPLARL